MPETRLVIGCMTGTSLDGLDAALVEITGTGLDMTAKFRGMVSKPLGGLADELRHFANGLPAAPIDYMRAARRLGELHAQAVAELCVQTQIPNPQSQIAFVVAHGQTIWHSPDDREASPSGGAGLSWQLFDPWPIVRRISVPVCYDLRQADLIAGGQGAPITPIADWVMYRHPTRKRLVVNLGGVCNATVVAPDADPHTVTGRDIGPCNLLIDGLVRRLFPGRTCDLDGTLSGAGAVEPALMMLLKRDEDWFPVDENDRTVSLGREQFDESWLSRIVHSVQHAAPADVLATAHYLIANQVASMTAGNGTREVVLAGGGCRNPTLVREVRSNANMLVPMIVTTSDELGIPVEAREAMAFAVLGALSRDGVPITLPQVTGAKNPGRAGVWAYP